MSAMNYLEDNPSVARKIPEEWIANQIRQHVDEEGWLWLTDQVQRIAADPQPQFLARVFTTIPRNVSSLSKTPNISLEAAEIIGRNQLPLVVRNWPLVKLIRIWILMQIPPLDQIAYVSLIERLFTYGEIEELTALYAALPIYYYPEAWRQRCTEGIRSNIAPIRQAIMIDNHYPCRFLDKAAWNQMILKAFFTDENIANIIGLEERNNSQLAHALVDYAYELHAAKRSINPMLWILVSPYVNSRAFELMKQVFQEREQLLTRKALAFAFDRSSYDPAAEFLKANSELRDLRDVVDTPWMGWRGGAV